MLNKHIISKYEHTVQTILILVGIYSIIPFLLIAQYNYPSADDYGIAVKYSEYPLNYIFKDTYLKWSGRYFAILISALDPLNNKDYDLYKVVPVILIIAFVITLFFALTEFAKHYLTLKQRLAFTSLLVYLYLSATPSSSEAFYWFPSACIYHLSNILCLFLLIQLNRLQKSVTNTAKFFHLLFAALSAILIIGSNEISMFISLFTILLYSVHSFKKKRNIQWFVILISIVLTASVFSVFAPGNFQRLQFVQLFTQSTLWTITGAAGITFFYIFQWLVLILISTIVYIGFLGIPIANKCHSVGNSFQFKRMVLLFMGLIVFLQLFTLWFAGGSNLGRIENVVYFLFLIGYFFCLQLYLNQLSSERISNISSNRFLIAIGVVAFIISAFDLNNNITTAYIDLISGKAKRYNEELIERDTLVSNCKTDTCFVPALINVPKTIFFTDIKAPNEDDLDLWINQDYSAFMHRNYILSLSPRPSIKTNIETIKEMGKSIRGNILK